MNNLNDKFLSAVFAIKPPFFAFAGTAAAYYGFAPAYSSNNALRIIFPFALTLTALLSLLRVLDLHFRSNPEAPVLGYRFKQAYIAGIFFTLGFALGIAGRGAANNYSRVFLGLENDNIIAISGKLYDDPRNTASGRGMASLKLSASHGKKGLRTSARGNVPVFFPEGSIPRLKEFGRGSEIYIEGSFANTSSSYSKPPLFRAKSVHITRPASRFDQWRTRIRLALIAAFPQSENWGGLALALLLGIRDNLDSELSEQYSNAGSSYILALSGMHLAIVSSILAFFLKRPLGLKTAALVGTIFILVYVFLVGVLPSLVRAAIMYVLGATAIIFALPSSAALTLGYSFIIQIIMHPDSGGTISFILSYLALAGILSLGQGIALLFRGRLPEFIGSSLSASLGAFIATMGVCAVFFGSLSPIGIVAGLILVPLTTIFMIGSIAYLTLHFLPFFPYIIGKGLAILYTTLEITAKTAGRFPQISISNVTFYTVSSIILSVATIIVCKIIHEKRIYLERFA
ncbi:MAG: ComEC/Rec2 family competence protein [Spirochaetaceae bacterium]|jgi:competence protein ComEC|nr:ComEC/Rec2 family competence protein [Spirochaetaceae bacterium]